MCKKANICPHCDEPNGTIKRVVGQACKIGYDKFRNANSESALTDFIEQFEYSISLNKHENLEKNLKMNAIDMDPLRVQAIFENILPEDIVFFDMDADLMSPCDLIINYIPVPPSCIRPTVKQQDSTNEDDLTAKMMDFISLNVQIKQGIKTGMDPDRLLCLWYDLQCHVAKYFNSDTPGLPNKPEFTKSIRGLNQRLKGK